MAFVTSWLPNFDQAATLPRYRGQEFTPDQQLQTTVSDQQRGLYRGQGFTVSQPRIATVRRTAIYRGVRVPVQ